MKTSKKITLLQSQKLLFIQKIESRIYLSDSSCFDIHVCITYPTYTVVYLPYLCCRVLENVSFKRLLKNKTIIRCRPYANAKIGCTCSFDLSREIDFCLSRRSTTCLQTVEVLQPQLRFNSIANKFNSIHCKQFNTIVNRQQSLFINRLVIIYKTYSRATYVLPSVSVKPMSDSLTLLQSS